MIEIKLFKHTARSEMIMICLNDVSLGRWWTWRVDKAIQLVDL